MNDYYAAPVTYDSILSEAWDQQRKNQFKRCQAKRLTLMFGVGLTLALFLVFFFTDVPQLVLSFPVGLTLITMLIVHLSYSYSGSKTTMYDIIYSRGVQLYNQEHDPIFQYEFAPKLDKEFNVSMGLFTRHASISSKFKMVGTLEDSPSPTIQHCRMITSNGKSSTTHFDGIYMILPIRGIPTQQLRTGGRPHLKGIKMSRLEDYEERVYVPEEHTNDRPHPILMGIFHELPDLFELRHHYVASNNYEVHIALWFRHAPKLPKTLEYHSLEAIITHLHSIMNYSVEQIHRLEEML